MAENLNIDHFRNGDPIPHVKTGEEWAKAGNEGKPAWCYYDNDPANGEKYGKLYNWHAVNDPRGLAPEGWHVPSDEEWTTLIDYLGGEDAAGIKMKSQNGCKANGNGTNESGFSGLSGGVRSISEAFGSVDSDGYWWSSTENFASDAWVRNLSCNSGDVGRGSWNKGYGFSVRCVRD